MEENQNCVALMRLVSRYPALNEDQSISALLSQVNHIAPFIFVVMMKPEQTNYSMWKKMNYITPFFVFQYAQFIVGLSGNECEG